MIMLTTTTMMTMVTMKMTRNTAKMMDTMDNYDNEMMTLDKLCLDNLHITNDIPDLLASIL